MVQTERSSQRQAAEGSAPRQCLDCGYIIDHLPETRCPECGKDFDPNKSETYWIRPTGAKRGAINCGFKAALAFLATFASVVLGNLLSMRWSKPIVSYSLGLLAIVGIGFGFAYVSGVAATAQRSIPPWTLKNHGIRPIWAPGLTVFEHVCWATAGFCFAIGLLMFASLFWSVL
jgi:predicted RNA-binding Zn-ribbon protein involved in translation (DUF1610 family)